MMYRVKNRGASTVVYKIPEDGIRREFKPGQTLQISSEELEKLTYQPGGTLILSQFLQILDLEGIQKVGDFFKGILSCADKNVGKTNKSSSYSK